MSQKKLEPKNENTLRQVCESIEATKLEKNALKYLAEKCPKPTVPKPIASIIIKSVSVGFFFTFCVKSITFSFNSSIAVVSAFNHLFILSFLPMPISKIAIQTFAITISTITIPPYFAGLYL